MKSVKAVRVETIRNNIPLNIHTEMFYRLYLVAVIAVELADAVDILNSQSSPSLMCLGKARQKALNDKPSALWEALHYLSFADKLTQ